MEIQIRCGWFGHAARSRFSCLNVSLRRDVSGTIKMASYQLGLTHTPAAVRNRSCNCISESHKGVCHTRIASSISSISRFFVRNFTRSKRANALDFLFFFEHIVVGSSVAAPIIEGEPAWALTTQSRGPPWKLYIQASYHPARRSLILVVSRQRHFIRHS